VMTEQPDHRRRRDGHQRRPEVPVPSHPGTCHATQEPTVARRALHGRDESRHNERRSEGNGNDPGVPSSSFTTTSTLASPGIGPRNRHHKSVIRSTTMRSSRSCAPSSPPDSRSRDAGVGDQAHFSPSALYARSSRFRILPVAVLGSTSRNSTTRGYL
jgi:hypothetical protein